MKLPKLKFPSVSYVYFLPIFIFLAKALLVFFPEVGETSYEFLSDFTGAFGVLYGVLLPLVLVRTIEIYDNVDQEFEMEAHIVNVLFENLSLLSKSGRKFKNRLRESLLKYVRHIVSHYGDEGGNTNVTKFQGDDLLMNIRQQCIQMSGDHKRNKAESEVVIQEFLQRLAELENTRVKRIEHSRRAFSGSFFQAVVVLSGFTFLLPFYIKDFTAKSSLVEEILVALLTLIVIFLNLIIDDLDQPFSGVWKISSDTWSKMLSKMEEYNE